MSYRSARQKAGKTVAEVASHIGVTEGAVYQWEGGFSDPTVSKIRKLAEFYGCSIDYLLKEDE